MLRRRKRKPGSPPRWRGAPYLCNLRRRGHGITPALAGSTLRTATSTTAWRDHPRVGGEHRSSRFPLNTGWGSPPRWRGAREAVDNCLSAPGITPALAGSTVRGGLNNRFHKDHPRVGGEHDSVTWSPELGRGSPPRWRGAQPMLPISVPAIGITPALAGSTWYKQRLVLGHWDHPRVGGEHLHCIIHQRLYVGSPPRWRGALAVQQYG